MDVVYLYLGLLSCLSIKCKSFSIDVVHIFSFISKDLIFLVMLYMISFKIFFIFLFVPSVLESLFFFSLSMGILCITLCPATLINHLINPNE